MPGKVWFYADVGTSAFVNTSYNKEENKMMRRIDVEMTLHARKPCAKLDDGDVVLAATPRRGSLLCSLTTLAVAIMFAVCVSDAIAGVEYTIDAPNGVGDVVSLTNALKQLNALASRDNARVWLEAGVYDLRGVFMDSENHLVLAAANGAMIAGLGDVPDKTILLGGGDDSEKGRHRILAISGTNFGYTTVSNLTVTGGYSTGNGGGIGDSGNGSVQYCRLIVSNNYAVGSNGGGGGGCFRGRAFNCLFENNGTSQWGGGLWTSGGCALLSDTQGAWDCVFTGNYGIAGQYKYGGALKLAGKCARCTFKGNRSNHGGAVYVSDRQYVWKSNALTNTTDIVDSVFEGNYLVSGGDGSAVYNSAEVVLSNCVFAANVDSNGGQGVVCRGDLYDCVITNNSRVTSLLYDCNLERCVVSGNTVSGNAALIDKESVSGTHTNINCVFADNVMKNYGRISDSKTFLNCTIVGNDSQAGANWGFICNPACSLVNCVLSGNKIGNDMLDIRPVSGPGGSVTNALRMTNCVFVKSQNGVGENWEGLVNCRKVADVKFVDATNGNYTPTTRSSLYNTGFADDGIVTLIGDRDIVGNRRVFGGGLDIGAYECQLIPPGFVLSFR